MLYSVLVCHCRAISDREILRAVQAGARTPEDVTRRCGAGGDCGTCLPSVMDLVEEVGGHCESALR